MPNSAASPLLAALNDAVGLDSLLAALIPDSYAPYRQLVGEAVVHFLQRLAPQRQLAIANRQFALANASPWQRLADLLAHSPLLHKLGQTIARDPRLAPDIQGPLQALEQSRSALDQAATQRLLDAALGGELSRAWRDCGGHLTGPPIAEASVAIVAPCRYQHQKETIDGVFKLLKPGIKEKLAEELSVATAMGEWLEERSAALGLPALGFQPLLEQVARKLQQEVNLEGEQRHLLQASAFYQGSTQVVVPQPLPFCSAAVTAMSYLPGIHIMATSTPSRRAHQLGEALLAEPFWSTQEQVLIHGDPHPGNLLAMSGSRIGLLDWSLAVTLDKRQRSALVQLVIAALGVDRRWMTAALGELCQIEPNALEPVLQRALMRLSHQFIGLDWLLTLLSDALEARAIHLDDSLLLLRKSLYTLQNVLHQLDANASLNEMFMAKGLNQLYWETPLRFMGVDHRHLSSHLSQRDLIQVWSRLPTNPWRYWLNWASC